MKFQIKTVKISFVGFALVSIALFGMGCEKESPMEDSEQEIIFTKTFGGSSEDYGNSVQQTTDGGYILTGYTESYGAGHPDVWLIKTNIWSDTVWTKTFGGSSYDLGQFVQQTADGGYIIAGETLSYGVGNDDVWLIKTDANGSEEWNRTFGGIDSDWGWSVQQTADRGYIIAGGTHSYGTGGGSGLSRPTSLGMRNGTRPSAGVLMMVAGPFSRPPMEDISLPGIPCLTAQLLMMSGSLRPTSMGMRNGTVPLAGVLLIVAIPSSRPPMAGIS